MAAVPGPQRCVTPATVTFELALDHVPDLFLLVVVPVDVRALVELPPHEGVVLRMEEASAPARTLVDDFELLSVEKRHDWQHTSGTRFGTAARSRTADVMPDAKC